MAARGEGVDRNSNARGCSCETDSSLILLHLSKFTCFIQAQFSFAPCPCYFLRQMQGRWLPASPGIGLAQSLGRKRPESDHRQSFTDWNGLTGTLGSCPDAKRREGLTRYIGCNALTRRSRCTMEVRTTALETLSPPQRSQACLSLLYQFLVFRLTLCFCLRHVRRPRSGNFLALTHAKTLVSGTNFSHCLAVAVFEARSDGKTGMHLD